MSLFKIIFVIITIKYYLSQLIMIFIFDLKFSVLLKSFINKGNFLLIIFKFILKNF